MRKTASLITLTTLALGGLVIPADAAPTVRYSVDAQEDGSGTIYRHDWVKGKARTLEVVSVDGGTLPWDCDGSGNLACGPGVPPGADHRTKTITLVVKARPGVHLKDPLALTYSTTGKTTWRKATAKDYGRAAV